MANGYIVNCAQAQINVTLNSGTPTKVNPSAVAVPSAIPATGTLTSNLYAVPYVAGISPDQLGSSNAGGGTPNSIIVSSQAYAGGQTPTYKISIDQRQVNLHTDVYVWVYLDNVFCSDGNGNTQGFTVTKVVSMKRNTKKK